MCLGAHELHAEQEKLQIQEQWKTLAKASRGYMTLQAHGWNDSMLCLRKMFEFDSYIRFILKHKCSISLYTFNFYTVIIL